MRGTAKDGKAEHRYAVRRHAERRDALLCRAQPCDAQRGRPVQMSFCTGQVQTLDWMAQRRFAQPCEAVGSLTMPRMATESGAPLRKV